ncbi:MAG: dTDP-4-dehydrorhamnose 3,5-epimerase [Verrucomicrobiaceae bacterium]|nr:dTDP-4-dehydrorhamnose 3,5-epimerase [Verrucomicrobiaceae bacterium]
MNFLPTQIEGVWIVEMERRQDERGWFARTWCKDELKAHGLDPALAQCSSSFNHKRGTLRGMHYQAAPNEEVKLVRCTRGAVFDVVLDLRPDSQSFKHWHSVELSADNGRAIYIPKGCAHGYQTLMPDTELHYIISNRYIPESGRGLRWDDPTFGILWPMPDQAILSRRDASYPYFTL